MRKICILPVILLFACEIFSQNYTILGSASQLSGCNCFQLTPDANDQGGAIYQNKTINLNNSFDFTFSVFLGCRNGNDAADGIVFVLTSNPNGLGQQGEYLGYGNGSNQPYSLAVEFDTWSNGNHGDPGHDHIAIESGGSVDHTVTGHVPALPGGGNIDNCQWYIVRIVWDVNTNTYSVYFNGVLVQQIVSPYFVSQYFGGNPIVNWGWSGATGGGTNDQRVCVQNTSNWVAGINYQSCDLAMQFTDISTVNVGSIQSWAWTFGDNTTSTQQNPSHIYGSTGTYPVTLTITDISGCTNTYQHDVTINPPVTLTDTLQQPPCNGGLNGNIRIGPSGGFGASAGYGGFTYTWNGGAVYTRPYEGIPAGTYSVFVTDGVCTASATYTLDQPPPLFANTSHTDATCGANDGTASIIISGGTPPYTSVDWGAGGIGNTVTGLAMGVYVPDFHDFNGCSSLLQYREIVNSLPCGIVSSTSSTDVKCFGGSSGTATATVTGGGLIPTITWSNGIIAPTITGLIAGTYTFTYTDNVPANTFTGSVTVNEPGAVMVATITAINMSCDDTNDGQALASVTSGGVAPFSYAWSRGQPDTTIASAMNLTPGGISVTITDFNGCTATASDTITGPPTLTAVITPVHDSCYHSKKGSAIATASGGTPPYTYYWDNISTAETNLDLGAGTYNVTVFDFKGCTVTGTAIITEPDTFTHTLASQNIDCFGNNNGSITVVPNGGTLSYNYAWNPATAIGNNPTGLAAGQYNLTLTDANNCKILDSVIITQPASALNVISSHTDASCNGAGASNGTMTLNISGGTAPYTYLGNPIAAGITVVPDLPPAVYSGDVVDTNGCSVTVSETITGPGPQTLTMSPDTMEPCHGSNTATASATFNNPNPPGTDIYVWTGGLVGSTITGLGAGVYVVTATDGNGCSLTDTVTITEPDTFTHILTSQNIDCFGNNNGSIDVVPDGGTPLYNYLWNPATAIGNNPTGLVAGHYILTLTDANNCMILDTVVITEPASALNVTSSHTDASCNGAGASNGTMTLNISGGTAPYTYLGNPIASGTTVIPDLPPAMYSGNVVDTNGCSVPISETITGPALQTLTVNNTNEPCNGGNTATANAIFNNPNPPGTDIYVWTGNLVGSSITGLSAGVYVVTATDGNGCSLIDSVTVTEPTAQVLDVSFVNALCFGDSGTATANPTGAGTFTYNWSSGGNTQIVSLPPGDYLVTATDANSCNQISDSFTITQPDSISVSEIHQSPKCFGSTTGYIILSVSGGTTPPDYTYSWSPNVSTSTSALNIPAGTYSVTVADANSCTVVKTYMLLDAAALNLTSNPGNVVCDGQSNGTITAVATGGTLPYSFSASADGVNIFSSTNGVFNDLGVGDYSITVTDSNSCVTTGSQIITQPDSVLVDVTPETVEVPFGEPLQINTTTNQSGTLYYAWAPESGLTCYDCANPQFIGDESQIYTIEVSTQAGCFGNAQIEVTVLTNDVIFIPNAFTPNNDAQNDFWQLYGDRATIKTLQAKIFNRWGEKVFESNDLNFKWDGTYKGKIVNPDVYVYVVTVEWLNKPDSKFKGSVTVLK